MLKPYFVDLLLLAVLLSFSFKGWLTGFIRSVMTLAAAIGGYVLSAMMPLMPSVFIHYLLPPASPNYLVINRLTSFVLFFLVLQGLAFVLTGLFENIRLGGADKFFGLLLGVLAGVFLGLQPGIAILSSPVAVRYAPDQRYFKETLLMRAYEPLIRTFVRSVPRVKPRR